jgi:hypothetical protein
MLMWFVPLDDIIRMTRFYDPEPPGEGFLYTSILVLILGAAAFMAIRKLRKKTTVQLG